MKVGMEKGFKIGKRIGMILDKTFPPDPRVENEAIELQKQGHQVFLFCLTYTNQKKNERISGIEVVRYSSNKIEYKLSALAYTIPFYSYLMKNKIADFLAIYKIDVIHAHDMVVAEAVFLANKKQLPVVLDLHENRPQIMKFYPHLKKFPANVLISVKKWQRKEAELINKASKLIVVTEEAKKEVLTRTQIKATNIAVVPNTVRKSFYQNIETSAKKDTTFNLLYIGDTGERRGLKTVIESLPELQKSIKNIRFVIVGKVSSELENSVNKLALNKVVIFEGWQNESTFQNYIVNSDVCLSPLHRNIHHDTTYANKLFQYMSLGIPLLVSNATAQENLVKHVNSGLVHEAKNVADFTAKVLELYHNTSLRETLAINGKEFVNNRFTWDKTSEELINLYANL
ncbi:glycosyltransferase family 4 protein [Tenacibaculum piscium]|uniref:glycosyltransferase family 4 protein n=1 Tax=Tenacibaculum piscium TaxID=1458515 RepID=UPI001F5549FD|nr:glycosyltransferase family 4 protein [Tenacibaculum piscium]